MSDTLELFRPLCNGSVQVESRTEKLTGDAGFLLLREVLDRAALIEPLAAQLEDPRDPRRVTHSLPSLLRYCARPPFAADRLEELDAQRLIYRLPNRIRTGAPRSSSRRWSWSAALPRWSRRPGSIAIGTTVYLPRTRPCVQPSPLWRPSPWRWSRHPIGR